MQSSKLWYQPGLSYPRVGTLGLGVRLAQSGEVFSGNAIGIFTNLKSAIFGLLSFLNSSPALLMFGAHGRYRKTETIAIKDLPVGRKDIVALESTCGDLAEKAALLVYQWEAGSETSPYSTHQASGKNHAFSLKLVPPCSREFLASLGRFHRKWPNIWVS